MKLLNKKEIINAAIVLIIVLIPNCDAHNEQMKKLALFTFAFLAFRFLFPVNTFKFLYIDFSKIINVIIWAFIIALFYFTDKAIITTKLSSLCNGTLLVIIFTYFISMRGIFYLINKREPAWYSKSYEVGEYDECLDRRIDKIDQSFIRIYFGLLVVVVLIVINL